MHHFHAAGFVACLVLAGLNANAVVQERPLTEYAVEVGITPESLVIADFTVTESTTIFGQLDAAEDEREAVDYAHAEIVSDSVTVAQLRQALAYDPENDDLLSQLEQAEADLAMSRATLDANQQDLLDVALEGMISTSIQALDTWRDGCTFRVLPEFRVADREDEKWRALEVAVRAEKRAIRRNEELDEDNATLLAEVRSDPDVQQAILRLDENLETMQAWFESQ